MTVASASSGSVRPIETRSVSEQVTNEIRRSILGGTLPRGADLAQDEALGDELLASAKNTEVKDGSSEIPLPAS